MLRKYKELDVIFGSFGFDSRMSVTVDGRLYGPNKEIINPTDGLVTITFLGKEIRIRKEWVVAMFYKPLYGLLNLSVDWTVLFADGDEENYHPDNLIWKPPFKGQMCPGNNGFYVIPGYSGFAINKVGVAINRTTGKVLKKRKAYSREKDRVENPGNYYLNLNVVTDSGYPTSLGVHRALALAFIEYDKRVNELTVNHKDGVKNHNNLLNIEWSTFSENNIHAMDLGLRTSRTPTLVFDHIEGQEYLFDSLTEASDFIGINTGQGTTNLGRDDYLLKGRYSIKGKDSTKPWPNISKSQAADSHKEYLDSKEKRCCVARRISDDTLLFADNPGKLAAELGLTKDQVETALVTDSPWPVVGFEFDWVSDGPRAVIRKYSPKEIDFFKDKLGIRNPCITYLEGEREDYSLYPSFRTISLEFGLNEKNLAYYLNKYGKFTTSKVNDSPRRIIELMKYDTELE